MLQELCKNFNILIEVLQHGLLLMDCSNSSGVTNIAREANTQGPGIFGGPKEALCHPILRPLAVKTH